MSMTFSEALLATISVGATGLTDAQINGLQTFVGDSPDDPTKEPPRVRLLKWMVYRRAVRAGQVSADTAIDAVNWQGLLAFIQALLPIILEIVKLFGG